MGYFEQVLTVADEKNTHIPSHILGMSRNESNKPGVSSGERDVNIRVTSAFGTYVALQSSHSTKRRGVLSRREQVQLVPVQSIPQHHALNTSQHSFDLMSESINSSLVLVLH